MPYNCLYVSFILVVSQQLQEPVDIKLRVIPMMQKLAIKPSYFSQLMHHDLSNKYENTLY